MISSSRRRGERPRVCQGVDDRLCKTARRKLNGRQIDGNLEVAGPACSLSAGLAQRPLAYRHDEAGCFAGWDKIDRRNLAPLRMVPAQQRLAAADLIRLQVENWLVVQLEFACSEYVHATCDSVRWRSVIELILRAQVLCNPSEDCL